MEIHSRSGYPASSLSNFAGHRFMLDGVECFSMEGFLQSVKFKNLEIQKEVCRLIGFAAKKRGSRKNWKRDQMLYWNEKEYPRDGDEYQELLNRAYRAMFDQSESFRKALKATDKATLKHSIGKRKKSETVITRSEFCSRLTKLREKSRTQELF